LTENNQTAVLPSADCTRALFNVIVPHSVTARPQMSVYSSPKPQYGLPCAHRSTALCADLALRPNNKCGKLRQKFT